MTESCTSMFRNRLIFSRIRPESMFAVQRLFFIVMRKAIFR